MNANLEKKKNYHESPLFVIRWSLYLMKENSIFLKKPVATGNNFIERKFFYKLDRVGKNVKIQTKNSKYRNIKIDDIKGRKIFILVNLKFIKDISSFFLMSWVDKWILIPSASRKKPAHYLQ